MVIKPLIGGFGGGGHGGMNMDFLIIGDIFGSALEAVADLEAVWSQRRTKGSNLRIKVKLTLEEIANGVEKGKSKTYTGVL
jgi:molecular chaperone DnaJ